MNEISVLSQTLIAKLKNRGLVKPTATRVIIDIDIESEWVQLYTSEQCKRQHETHTVATAIEIIGTYLGKQVEPKKQPAPKPKREKKDKDK